jgi:hypothetical protein
MHRLMHFNRAMLCALFVTILLSVPSTPAQHGTLPASRASRPRFAKAFVVDDRLSALRHDADVKSPVIHRLRIGRPVFIFAAKTGGPGQPLFYRVAVSRRTRGWIHEAAIAVPGRAGEDERFMKLTQNMSDGVDRIALCKLFLEHFNRSALAPRALLAIGEEADQAAATLTRQARKRLKELDGQNGNASIRDYYLNDSGLDRYSKLRVAFDFKDSTAEYRYDGKAYREIIRRFPDSEEARVARTRLDRPAQRLARQK